MTWLAYHTVDDTHTNRYSYEQIHCVSCQTDFDGYYYEHRDDEDYLTSFWCPPCAYGPMMLETGAKVCLTLS